MAADATAEAESGALWMQFDRSAKVDEGEALTDGDTERGIEDPHTRDGPIFSRPAGPGPSSAPRPMEEQAIALSTGPHRRRRVTISVNTH